VLGIDYATGSDIDVRRLEGFVKGSTVGFVKPITRIQRQQLNFGALGQIRGLVNDQTAVMDACLDGHGNETITTPIAQQGFAADAGTGSLSWRR